MISQARPVRQAIDVYDTYLHLLLALAAGTIKYDQYRRILAQPFQLYQKIEGQKAPDKYLLPFIFLQGSSIGQFPLPIRQETQNIQSVSQQLINNFDSNDVLYDLQNMRVNEENIWKHLKKYPQVEVLVAVPQKDVEAAKRINDAVTILTKTRNNWNKAQAKQSRKFQEFFLKNANVSRKSKIWQDQMQQSKKNYKRLYKSSKKDNIPESQVINMKNIGASEDRIAQVLQSIEQVRRQDADKAKQIVYARGDKRSIDWLPPVNNISAEQLRSKIEQQPLQQKYLI